MEFFVCNSQNWSEKEICKKTTLSCRPISVPLEHWTGNTILINNNLWESCSRTTLRRPKDKGDDLAKWTQGRGGHEWNDTFPIDKVLACQLPKDEFCQYVVPDIVIIWRLCCSAWWWHWYRAGILVPPWPEAFCWSSYHHQELASFFFPINALVSSFNPSLMNWPSEETQSMIEQQIRAKTKWWKTQPIYHKIQMPCHHQEQLKNREPRRRQKYAFYEADLAGITLLDMLPHCCRMTKEITRNMSIRSKVHLAYLG